MNSAVSDWQRWRDRWSSRESPDVDPSEMRSDIDRAIGREQRRLGATRLKVAIVCGVALLSVAGALLHEARSLDFIFAALLVLAVIAVAILDVQSRRIPVDVSSRPTRVFVELSTARLRRELRISRLILLPILIEIGFFVQWWIGGIPFHEHEPFARVVILTGWLPFLGMIAVLTWALRLSARVQSEMRGLTSLADRGPEVD